MKALNRAIGRTVSQLARYGGEGCHPPMLMALENHLDALLTMERKQLEVAGMKVVNITNTCTVGSAQLTTVRQELARAGMMDGAGDDKGQSEMERLIRTPVEKWTYDQLEWFKANTILSRSQVDVMVKRWYAANTPAQPAPAPDVIDMTDPANWQVGDVLLRTGGNWQNFEQGKEYLVMKVKPDRQEICVGTHDMTWTVYAYDLLKQEHYFTWLRHAEAQA